MREFNMAHDSIIDACKPYSRVTVLTCSASKHIKQVCFLGRVSLEELTDILVGLEQRNNAYKNRLHEHEKKTSSARRRNRHHQEVPGTCRDAASRGGGQGETGDTVDAAHHRRKGRSCPSCRCHGSITGNSSRTE